MKVINAGAVVEDVNSMPEEHNEKHSDTNIKNHFATAELLLSTSFDAAGKYYDLHQFSLVENIYFDVPYSPPELG